jgi:hypothetical protein
LRPIGDESAQISRPDCAPEQSNLRRAAQFRDTVG